MVVIDVFTRRIIGFGVARGDVDGVAVCWMFNHALVKHPLPKYVSTDNDPLFRFHRWLSNLRILGVEEIKSVPFVPQSHPFVERLIVRCGASISIIYSFGMGQTLSTSSLRTATTITSTVAMPA